MMINATLLVQIANFIVAYYLLRFLFLNPVSRMIEQEDDVKKRQHEAISVQKDQVAQHVVIKREEWQQCQKYFRENSPEILARPVMEKKGSVVKVHEVPEAATKKMRETITKLIISKVEHVS
jgi:hypothetical protein